MADSLNDNETKQSRAMQPDAHGQAAMLLVESLIHGLVARKLITLADAIEIVQVAADVKQEIADELGDTPASLKRSLDMLNSVSRSLKIDYTLGATDSQPGEPRAG